MVRKIQRVFSGGEGSSTSFHRLFKQYLWSITCTSKLFILGLKRKQEPTHLVLLSFRLFGNIYETQISDSILNDTNNERLCGGKIVLLCSAVKYFLHYSLKNSVLEYAQN